MRNKDLFFVFFCKAAFLRIFCRREKWLQCHFVGLCQSLQWEKRLFLVKIHGDAHRYWPAPCSTVTPGRTPQDFKYFSSDLGCLRRSAVSGWHSAQSSLPGAGTQLWPLWHEWCSGESLTLLCVPSGAAELSCPPGTIIARTTESDIGARL